MPNSGVASEKMSKSAKVDELLTMINVSAGSRIENISASQKTTNNSGDFVKTSKSGQL